MAANTEPVRAPTLLLAHGWGFDAASLAPLATALRERGLRVASVERGELGAEPVWPEPDAAPVLVGHSAGFPALLRRYGTIGRAAIALAGFTRFAATAGFPDGVPPRLLSRMAARLDDDPRGTVDAFRERCGGTALPDGARPDPARLATGLRALAGDDPRDLLDAMRARGVPVRSLAARHDPVVSSRHAAACFRPDELHWMEGGHLFPIDDPAGCAEAVAGLLTTG